MSYFAKNILVIIIYYYQNKLNINCFFLTVFAIFYYKNVYESHTNNN